MSGFAPNREALGALVAELGLDPSKVVEFPVLETGGLESVLYCEMLNGDTGKFLVSGDWARRWRGALNP